MENSPAAVVEEDMVTDMVYKVVEEAGIAALGQA